MLQTNRGRGSLAVADQIVVSGTNFLTTVLVGRVCGADELGLFAIGFSVIVIVATAMRSLLVTPFSVFVHRVDAQRQRQMRGATLVLALMFLAGIVTVLVVGNVIWAMRGLGSTQQFGFSLAVCVATACWTLREFARQLSFADLRFARSLAIDSVAALIQLCVVGALIVSGKLSATTAMYACGFATAIMATGWFWANSREFDFSAPWRADWKQTWDFGRWGALSQTSHVIQSYVVSWIVALAGGLTAAGVYAAAWSIVQLASPFVQGAGNAMGPVLAKKLADDGLSQLKRLVIRVAIASAALAAMYVSVIWLSGGELIQLFYGQRYEMPALLLTLLAGSVAVSAIALVATKAISVLEFPQVNFALNVTGLALTTLFGIVLGTRWGIEGAAGGLLLAAAIGFVLKWGCYRQVCRRSLSRPSA